LLHWFAAFLIYWLSGSSRDSLIHCFVLSSITESSIYCFIGSLVHDSFSLLCVDSCPSLASRQQFAHALVHLTCFCVSGAFLWAIFFL
jgi:hypothetical protein